MKPTRSPKGDPMELRIEGALRPGDFIGYRDDGDFVEDLDGIKDEIVKLTKIGKAQRAVGLFEAFIAGCYLKAEEIDDSGGSFGAFVGELFCAWVQARQRAKADPHETATRLLVWMEKDDYGFCHRLEDDAVKVLSKAGLAAFERAVREQFDRGVPGGGDARAERRASFWRRHLRDVLKTITAARDDVPAYLAVCGDDVSPKDCEVVAQMHATGKRLAEALSWVERGLKLKDDKRWGSHDSYRLDEMKRDILKKLGRHEDALEAAWQEFTEAPSEYSYDDLMKYVPKTKRGEWHDKAMAAAEKGDLDGYLGICKRTKEWGPLAARIQRVPRAQIEAIGHYTAEPAAKGLAKAHPAAAAKVYVALGFRIVNAKKSKYYDAAIANFRAAKQCYEKAGLGGDWKKIAKTVRADHRRKSGFIKDFERIVSGEVDRPEPSFLDRARERWGQRPS